jgi:hypothetical protein
MGTMNLLKASVIGQLGKMYGAKDKKYNVIRVIPFSHTPHNATQTQCVRAFEVLNRFSSGIAKVFFPYMGLSDKKMLKHNAVAQMLKPLIATKAFRIKTIKQIIPQDGSCVINNFTVNLEQRKMTLSAYTTGIVDKENGSAWFIGIFSLSGKCIYSNAPDTQAVSLELTSLFLDEKYYFACAFRADKEEEKVTLHGWINSTMNYVINNRVFIDLFSTVANYSVEDRRLVINDDSVRIVGNRVVLDIEE